MANEYKVTFFNVLQNDEEEVIVRFPYTSKEQLGVVPAHSVKVGPAWKKIKCNRSSAYDPVDLCPLCADANKNINKVVNRFFIKLVYYVLQPDGTYKGQCAVWDRPEYIFKDKISSYLDEYGADLPNMVFKIKRHGAHGDQKTTYDILVPRQDIYPANVFVPNFDNFEGYNMEGLNYHVLTAPEMTNLLATGNLPARNVQPQTPAAQVYNAPTPAYQAPVQPMAPVQPVAPMAPVGTPVATQLYTPPIAAAPINPAVVQSPVLQPAAPVSDPLPQSFVAPQPEPVAMPAVNPLYTQPVAPVQPMVQPAATGLYQAPPTGVPQPNTVRRYNYE